MIAKTAHTQKDIYANKKKSKKNIFFPLLNVNVPLDYVRIVLIAYIFDCLTFEWALSLNTRVEWGRGRDMLCAAHFLFVAIKRIAYLH